MKKSSIDYLMLKRQYLLEPAGEEEYEQLFRLMSPVKTKSWSMPGSPPTIVHRTVVDDYALNNLLRSDRTIIKGRFQAGGIGYIYKDELPLFMAAYKKVSRSLNETDDLIYQVVRQEGPLNIGLIKEITGLLTKAVTPSLHKMQKAFMLYEDQIDGEWDRSWYILEDEFYDMEFDRISKTEAMTEVLKRFCYLNVFMEHSMIKSYTSFSNKDIKTVLSRMVEDSMLSQQTVGDKEGYVLSSDIDEIMSCDDSPPEDVFVFHLNDYAVKSHNLELKERFSKKPYTNLQYIMVAGEFKGAVVGYFRQGPHDVEDVIMDMSPPDVSKYRDRIIDAIYAVYDSQDSPIKRFMGKDMK